MDRRLHMCRLQFGTISVWAILALGCGMTVCSAAPPAESADIAKTDPALLVVSYDAFRPEYLRRGVTPYMNTFRKKGTSTEFMYNVFPTKTFPNHHTLATVRAVASLQAMIQIEHLFCSAFSQGFYPKSHGILANSLYDSKLGKLDYSYELYHYNESIWPIWVSV